jgi:2-polyprenyl-3-methyl-5-hydroxy-6-metoxy-1,4-benzoquinol methylase
MATASTPVASPLAIIRAYRQPVVRAYCTVRFHILRQRFLDEIGQYLPERGCVLDIGCGFGLFSLYYARRHPQLEILGIDQSASRIAMAQDAGRALGLHNAGYEVGNAASLTLARPFDCVYMLDLIHHLPPAAVRPLLAQLHALLTPGGRLLIKDVDTRPRYKHWFTWLLDKLMDRRAPVRYWPQAELTAALNETGFRTFHHAMIDYLPYPHVLYIAQKP